ncbi:MAG TPA: EamA family transporter [Phototrophicaceae bacterium]|nr:EamA family transporter [Phototrophicaceae bacterium]
MTAPNRPARWLLLLAFAMIYTVWGSTYLAIHFAIQTIPPFMMTGTRFFAAGVILFSFAKLRGAAWPSLKQWRSAAIIGFFLFLVNNGSIVWSEGHGVPTGIAAVLIATLPMWMVLLLWLKPGGKYPGGVVIAGIVIGFIGIILLADTDATTVNPVGVVALLIGSLAWAFGSLYSKSAPLPQSAAQANGMELLCGGTFQYILSILVGEPAALHVAQIAPLSLLGLGYLAIVSSVFTFSAYMWLIRVSKPAIVATYAYVNPVFAVLLGWLLAGEAVTPRTLIAAAIIIIAVIVVNVSQSRRQVRVAPEGQVAIETAG